MSMDRTDEIRQHVMKAREHAWAARLDYGLDLLAANDADSARAVLMELRSTMPTPKPKDAGGG